MLGQAFATRRGVFSRAYQYSMLGVVLAAQALLGGCVQQASRTHLAPKGDEGAVLLKISENRQTMGWAAIHGDAIAVRRVADAADASPECFMLKTSIRGLSASTFMGASLPPGTYEFPTVGAGDFTVGECNARVLLGGRDTRFGKFVIEPHRLTYLGTWERTGNSEVGKSLMIPMKETNPTGLKEVLTEVFPDLGTFADDAPLGWVDGTLPPDLDQVNRYALQFSYGLLDPSQEADGTWIFGSRTGVVRSWKPGGSSATDHDTGRRVVLQTTAVLADGSWLVGGEQSTLLRSSDRGKTWQSVRGNLPYGLITKLAVKQQDILLTLVDKDDVAVFRASMPSMQWTKVASYKKEFARWTGVPGATVQSFLAGDKYVTTLPSKQLAVYDIRTGVSESHDLPGGIQYFSVDRDQVLRCRCIAVLAVNPYQSSDFGRTWTSATYDRYFMMPAMRDAKNGAVWTQKEFAYTRDGGATWTKATQTSAKLPHVFYSNDGKSVYATDDINSIWSSTDDGLNWNPSLLITLPAGDRLAQ